MSFDPAALIAVHGRLLAGDPTASADLFEIVYGPLIGHAIKKHAAFGMDQDRARDLAVGVLAYLVERPELFDPQKGSLFGFLCMMLDGDAKNAGRDEANREEKFSGFAVEVEKVGGNSYVTSPETGGCRTDHVAAPRRDRGRRGGSRGPRSFSRRSGTTRPMPCPRHRPPTAGGEKGGGQAA